MRWFRVAAFVLLVGLSGFARVFFTGSNPHLTVFAFPQDILLVPGDYAYAYTSYQSLPWWGDIDDPENRPSETYLSTGEQFASAQDNSSFDFNSAMHVIQNRVGFSRTLNNGMKNRWDLEYSAMPLRSRAEGALPQSNTDFTYRQRCSIHKVYLKSRLAMKTNGMPIGFMAGAGATHTRMPNLKFDIEKGGETYSSNRLLWGWSSTEGDGVFGGGDDADARYHNEYATGTLYQMDLQTAATIPRHKMGVRMRFAFGRLNPFAWSADTNSSASDEIIRSNFAGSFQETKWAKKIRAFTIRPYINYTWYERPGFKFNTLVLSRFTQSDSIGVLSNNSDVDNGMHERSRTIIFQCNPNINVAPWKHKQTYIDAAFLLNYSHMRYDFLRDYWVGGGEKQSFVNTRAYTVKDWAWQDFSYGRRNFVEAALDIHTVFPIYGGPDRRVAGGLSLLLWRRFKWFNKYYGRNNISDNNISFEVGDVRKNFDREAWMNSVLNVFYSRKGYHFRVDIGQPLIYSLSPRTRVIYEDGRVEEEKHSNIWASQGGIKIGLFAATSLEKLKGLGLIARE